MRKIQLKCTISNPADREATLQLFKCFLQKYAKVGLFSLKEDKFELEIFEEEFDETVVELLTKLSYENADEIFFGDAHRENVTQNGSDISENQPVKSVIPIENVPENNPVQILEEETAKVDEPVSLTAEIAKGDEPVSLPTEKGKRSRKAIDEAGDRFLKQIASQSNSFDTFVENLSNVLKVSEKYKNFFVAMINTAYKIEKMKWEYVEQQMYKDGVKYNPYYKQYCSNLVADAFAKVGSTSSISVLMKEIPKYKNYDYSNSENLEIVDSAETDMDEIQTEEQHKVEEETETETVKSFFPKLLLDKIQSVNTDSEKIGVFLDYIQAEDVDDYAYSKYRKEFVEVIKRTMYDNDLEEENLVAVLKYNVEKVFPKYSIEDYRAVAFITQTIKKFYETERPEYRHDNCNFFAELKKICV